MRRTSYFEGIPHKTAKRLAPSPQADPRPLVLLVLPIISPNLLATQEALNLNLKEGCVQPKDNLTLSQRQLEVYRYAKGKFSASAQSLCKIVLQD